MGPTLKLLVLNVMDTSTNSENHENDDLSDFWKVNLKLLIQNEAEYFYGAFGPLLPLNLQ